MLPISSFRSFIQEHRLFSAVDKILLAVSGGKDSVLMAHLFNAAGFSFGIAHCNFKLRGAESEDDETFTRDLAARFGVSFYSAGFDTLAYAAEKGISVQMAARELRYQWFEEILESYDYQYIATAHHLSDSVETVLLNLVRGTGIAGLHGIRPVRGKILHPLLFLNREQIDALVRHCAIDYREDRSNASVKYARNKVRHQVIPVLKELNPELERTFETNIAYFSGLEQFLDTRIDALRHELFHPTREGFTIDIDALLKLHPQQFLWFELFKPFGFSITVLNDLAQQLPDRTGKVFLSAHYQILSDRGQLLLEPLTKDPAGTVLVQQGDSQITWNSRDFTLSTISFTGQEIPKDPAIAFLDAGLLIYPLTFRSWQQGDIFYPLGMKGKKKLSDLFTGLKVPLTRKSGIPVLVNGNGDILWVAGYRTDDRYKIGKHTKKVAIFETVK